MKLPSAIHTILFDLDNTLIDRDAAMKAGIKEWLKTEGMMGESKLDAEIFSILEKDNSGYTERSVFCEWLLHKYGNDHSKNTKNHKDILREIQELTISCLQPDFQVLSILEKMKSDYRLVIATNGSSYIQKKKIAKTKLDSLFPADQVYISENIGHSKPEGEFYEHILNALSTSPEQCLMVGDNYSNDIEAAKKCGLLTCWIDHRSTLQKNTADITFNTILEKAQWLRA